MKKIFNKSRLIFISILAFLSVFALFIIFVLPFRTYIILTDSMEPIIYPGDVVVMDKRFNIEELKQYDIIGFNQDIGNDGKEEVIFHKISSITNIGDDYEIKTVPEASDVDDPWTIYSEDVVGIYLFHVGGIGKLIYFFRSPLGIIALFINATAIVVAYKIIFSKKEKEI